MKRLALGFLLGALACACKQGSQTESGATKSDFAGTAATSDATRAEATVLEGNWALPCGTFGSSANPQAFTTGTKTFTGNQVSVSYTTYDDDNCTVKLSTFRTEGKFKLEKNGSDGTHFLDVTPIMTFWTPHTADKADENNAERICGGGFVQNQEKLLVKDDCGDAPAFKKSFSTLYGIVRVDGDQLFEGDVGPAGAADDGTSATRRPTRVRSRAMFRN